MQVKQQKKSSNKWTCVVCNEKQSVRKVFAQGFMAKDVRKFVQTFNMSRCQFEQQRTNETLDLVPEHTDCQPRSSNDKKRRSDWSEYVDPKDIHNGQEEEEQEEDVFGPRIVTELPPKELFKKPKLNVDSSGFGTMQDGKEPGKIDPTIANWASKRFDYKSQSEEGISAAEGPRRSLAKGDSNRRTYAKQLVEHGFAESRACHPTTAKVSSTKCGVYIIQDNNKDSEDKGPWKSQLRMMKEASKWDSYITEDDDEGDLHLKIGREFADNKGKWDDCEFDAKLYDQSAEEDIHPDFL
ncbi:hypothetical protein RHSIM_Rhsim06G0093000 [Rhododendron simsii]|uniref:MRN complex-interacting protein N-terminal domain-containing protein n=1 Tax=Rhododendron simsii TaxID=118357 RepID=A0A834GV34_RHOSS|nr:hypothetical protein RHSIM_Rhsim06G0093000 [Rhododendron simsii]